MEFGKIWVFPKPALRTQLPPHPHAPLPRSGARGDYFFFDSRPFPRGDGWGQTRGLAKDGRDARATLHGHLAHANVQSPAPLSRGEGRTLDERLRASPSRPRKQLLRSY